MWKSIKPLIMIATVLAAAMIPAVASARPVGPDVVPFSVEAPVVHQAAATQAEGFSWQDAGFGAAGMLALIGIGTGTLVAMRRRAILG